jgi:hypothetical protein
MQKIILKLVIISWVVYMGSVFTQNFDPFIQEKVDMVSYDSIYFNHQLFEQFGVKEVGSQSLNNTGNWIIDFYQQNGYTDIEIDSFYIGQNKVYNIIVTKTGATYPDTYLIVDGHYDTYNGPGANDNGSGTVVLLETARILADVETEYSIKFIHFTAEEIGLVGSTHYVQNIVMPQDLSIRLVFNIDGVGGVAGELNNTVTCERDLSEPNGNNAESSAFTDTLANLTEMYTDLNTVISYAYASDYIPFMENGYIVTGFYETNISPYYHTIYDNLIHLDSDYVFKIAKASVAATIYFACGVESSNGSYSYKTNGNQFNIHPNPFKDYLKIKSISGNTLSFSIFDVSGRLVYNADIKSKDHIKVYPNFEEGIYLYEVIDHNNLLVKSGKLIRN